MDNLPNYSLEDYLEGQTLLIDKPLGWTSFDVVKKIHWRIRNQFNIKKIKVGHAGTLDPRATGLLIVCTGQATKKISLIQDASKEYTGTLKLGATTPSYDTETQEDVIFEWKTLSDDEIINATKQFIGENISQYPPIFSAIKKDGKRLYEYARKGEEVQIEPRNIIIYDFKITKIDLPFVAFWIHCGKGTYIRSLAHDFGKALNSGAYLTDLRRIKIGGYTVENTINDLIK